MNEKNKQFPSEETLRKAMEHAWQDHHHARDQTWKTVQIVAVLGAGLLSIDVTYGNTLATAFAASLVIIASVFGVGITWNHRKLEIRKFIHIMNCEDLLGLHQDNIIPFYKDEASLKGKDENVQNAAVGIPKMYRFWDVFNFEEQNTSVFIMRIHLSIMAFAILVMVMRWIEM